jgi:hypothetical protein
MALAAIPAVAAPLLLHAFAWDAPRFTIMLVFGAFVLLVAVDRVTPTIGARAVTGLALLVTLFHAWWTVPLISGTDFDGEGAFALRTGPTTRTFFDCRPLFENAGFETGDLDRWEQKEGEFQIRKAVSDQGGRLRKGTSGTWWASSWDPVAGDRAEGILVSEPFVITGATIITGVGGGFDKRRLRAALVVDGVEVRSATGRNSNDLRPVAWDTREVVGQTARIEIIDRSQDRWGHIDVDGFCFFR